MNIKELANIIGCSTATIRMYICRYEFAHIGVNRGEISNIQNKDITRIKELYRRACQSRRYGG